MNAHENVCRPRIQYKEVGKGFRLAWKTTEDTGAAWERIKECQALIHSKEIQFRIVMNAIHS